MPCVSKSSPSSDITVLQSMQIRFIYSLSWLCCRYGPHNSCYSASTIIAANLPGVHDNGCRYSLICSFNSAKASAISAGTSPSSGNSSQVYGCCNFRITIVNNSDNCSHSEIGKTINHKQRMNRMSLPSGIESNNFRNNGIKPHITR